RMPDYVVDSSGTQFSGNKLASSPIQLILTILSLPPLVICCDCYGLRAQGLNLTIESDKIGPALKVILQFRRQRLQQLRVVMKRQSAEYVEVDCTSFTPPV